MIDGIKPPKRPLEPRPPAKLNLTATDEPEPAFVPPESIAAPVEEHTTTTAPDASSGASSRRSTILKFHPVAWFKGLSKKQKIGFTALVAVLLAALGAGAWALFLKPEPAPAPAPVVQEKKEEPPKPTIYYSPLTGSPVSKEQSEYPVIGVMIENSPDARPQSGLKDAGVVFEAIAEGGITRFLALFQEAHPDYVGPVRSVRPYYVDWLQGFDAAVAHVGGSGEALAKIRNEGVRDLDQFANPGPFNRVRTRYAPHNMYTNIGSLFSLAKEKGWNTSTFTGFPRKAEKPSASITANAIDITISGALYNVHYDYDATTNSYKRVLAGKPHLDERSKAQLSPKVVVVMIVPYSIHPDGVHSAYQTIGSGKTYVFQDGIATEGSWEKPSSKAQIVLKDAAGKPLELNAGQTWITATSIPSNVTYRP